MGDNELGPIEAFDGAGVGANRAMPDEIAAVDEPCAGLVVGGIALCTGIDDLISGIRIECKIIVSLAGGYGVIQIECKSAKGAGGGRKLIRPCDIFHGGGLAAILLAAARYDQEKGGSARDDK